MASEAVQSESMALANNHLAVHLHHLLVKEKENVFFSPFSLSTAMAMLLCGSINQTLDELRKALGYEHAGIATEDIASVIKQLMSSLLSCQGSYILTSANSVLIQEGFQLKEDYKSVVQDYFQALLLEVDFGKDTQNVVNQINDWVKKHTNNMIPQLLNKLYPATVAVLLNAVYFKGAWLQKFDKKKTVRRVFYNYGNEKQGKKVDMMRMKKTFFYIENNTFQALQLPYVGENIAMLILLPISRNGLESLETTLTPSFIHDVSKNMWKKKVDVSLPRFKLEYSKELVPFFKQLGVYEVFGTNAELGNFSDAKGIFVSLIIHKAVLEVNEEGSEAAAATAIIMGRCLDKSPDPVFTVDHPFVLVIYETKSKMILFMGRVQEL